MKTVWCRVPQCFSWKKHQEEGGGGGGGGGGGSGGPGQQKIARHILSVDFYVPSPLKLEPPAIVLIMHQLCTEILQTRRLSISNLSL